MNRIVPSSPVSHSQLRQSRSQVLRAVATFELAKGAVVLLAAFGVLSLVHRDVWDVAEGLLRFLHISRSHHYAQVFLALASGVTDRKLVLVAAGAVLYSSLRFLEAYGLWRERAWAEWVAFFSGAIYLPFEIRELFHRLTVVNLCAFLVNLAIVIYMLFLRLSGRKAPRAEITR